MSKLQTNDHDEVLSLIQKVADGDAPAFGIYFEESEADHAIDGVDAHMYILLNPDRYDFEVSPEAMGLALVQLVREIFSNDARAIAGFARHLILTTMMDEHIAQMMPENGNPT